MRSIVISTAIGALSLALSSGVIAASATGSSAHPGAKTQTTTQPSTNSSMAGTQSAQASATTTRGPAKTGQPNQDCESLGNQPGHSMSAPGSAFNPDGNAGTKYAGEQPQNSRNTASVSQYDVACARPSHK